MSLLVVCLRLGGSLKRSLGMVLIAFTIPKAFCFEAATLPSFIHKFNCHNELNYFIHLIFQRRYIDAHDIVSDFCSFRQTFFYLCVKRVLAIDHQFDVDCFFRNAADF